MSGHVVVVGASLAGLRSVEALRRLGHDGPITLVGAEEHLPYDRPPLSKEVITGDKPLADTALTDSVRVEELDIELRLGTRVDGLDLAAENIFIKDEKIFFDHLIIATGSHARRLSERDHLGGVHVIRTLDDAGALNTDLETAKRVVVIGGGFIGAEAASSARTRGCDVVVVEAAPAPMWRGLGDEMGSVCGLLHTDNGTDLRVGVGVAGLRAESGERVTHVDLADGTVLSADVVIVGIGSEPTTAWLGGSGLELDDGVVCDEFLCASPAGTDPVIYAAGDVARWPNGWNGEIMRVEHWTNAVEHAFAVARNIVAKPSERTVHESVPFVWSDQYGHRIQIAGRPHGKDAVEVVAGTVHDRAFVACYHRDGKLTGVMAIDMIKPFVLGRRLLMQRTSWSEAPR